MDKKYWIINPLGDILFFISPPLYIIPAVLFLKTRVSIEDLGLIIMGIGGLGHHLPGLIRAYSDPVLFKKFRLRFILAPIFFMSVCGYFALYDLSGLNLVLVAWGSWHAAMQVNGFLRIYDARAGSMGRFTAWLDWLMCLFWFTAVILLSPAKLLSLLGHFYSSGGWPLTHEFISGVRDTWLILTALVTAIYIYHALTSGKKGTGPSPLKILSLCVSISFWWFCMVTVDNLVFGVLMWELFHDIQYNAIVWVYNLNRVQKGITASSVEKFLFRPDIKKIGIYLLLVAGYGYFGILTNYIDVHSPDQMAVKSSLAAMLTKMTLLSAFLHFYFDGFIWKVRDSDFRKGLGLSDQEVKQAESSTSPGIISHSLKWCLFVIPVIFLAVSEKQHKYNESVQYSRLAMGIPDSWKANFLAGSHYLKDKKPDSALVFLDKAVRLKPGVGLPYKLMADAFILKGDTARSNEYRQRYYILERKRR